MVTALVLLEGVVLVALVVAVVLLWKRESAVVTPEPLVIKAPTVSEHLETMRAIEQVQLLIGKQGQRLDEHIRTTSHI